MADIVNKYYDNEGYRPAWSKEEKWQPLADSLYNCIANAELQGLFPNDYHFKNLHSLKNKLDGDSLQRMDAALWARADLMLTDGFMYLIKDLKQGRLQPDSISLNKDSALADNFFIANLKTLTEKKQFTPLLNALQPKHKGYWELKKGIKSFLDSMDKKTYTYVVYPYKKGDTKDSTYFIKTLQKRLHESNATELTGKLPDSAQLSNAIKKYQQQ